MKPKIAVVMKMIVAVVLSSFFSCAQKTLGAVNFESSALQIKQLTQNTYQHISYLELVNGQRFPCNGLIYVSKGEALVFDTPVDDISSLQLIDWIKVNLKSQIVGVVVNHFHVDCLGGLSAFHDKDIISFANQLTIELADKGRNEVPKVSFKDSLEIQVGSGSVINRFFGPGHSQDNIVSYIPSEHLLFGGCLIKEVGAGKGNLNDANLQMWPSTVRSIQKAYPELKHVVPGHGQVGGTELLQYTVDLFEQSN